VTIAFVPPARAVRAVTPKLSVRQRIVFGLIEQAALAGRRCPTNHELADAMNVSGAAYTGAVVGELVFLGLIRVTRHASGREVEIVATGARTAAMDMHRAMRPQELRGPSSTLKGYAGNGYRGVPPEGQYVDRDPCWRCETRTDVGCRHRPASGTAPVAWAPKIDGRKVDRGQGLVFRTRRYSKGGCGR